MSQFVHSEYLVEHKSIHKYTWDLDLLDNRLMIDFIAVPSDLQLYVLDTHVKRRAAKKSKKTFNSEPKQEEDYVLRMK